MRHHQKRITNCENRGTVDDHAIKLLAGGLDKILERMTAEQFSWVGSAPTSSENRKLAITRHTGSTGVTAAGQRWMPSPPAPWRSVRRRRRRPRTPEQRLHAAQELTMRIQRRLFGNREISGTVFKVSISGL